MARISIGVIGTGECDQKTYQIAFRVGELIAHSGYDLVCGGLGGVMEAAAKGCKSAGGLAIGIIPQERAENANPFIDIVIPTGMGIMRNLLVVRSAAGLIAIDGRYGTLSEIAYAVQLEKPIVGIETWSVSDQIEQFDNPDQAVKRIIKLIEQ